MDPRADARHGARRRAALRGRLRIAWAVLSVLVVISVAIGLAAVPAAAFWRWHLQSTALPIAVEVFILAMALVPSYLLFAVALMIYAALATRLFGWRTRDGLEISVSDYDWPLLDWARYLIITHVVRVFAGPPFRATPVWTMFLRLNGARIGRGAWVNSLALMDHNLLEIGEGAIIGSDAHVSGHTVERGTLLTARVRIGARATVGIGSVIGIGSDVGDGAEVGALSVVPKHTRVAAESVWVGAHPQSSPHGSIGSSPDDRR